jgi:ribA/ribD-fused uncharacterized protein
MDKDVIGEFQGKYRFLSNFHPSEIHYDGIIYPTVEHAYQAHKSAVPEARQGIADAKTPGDAKRMGKKVHMRANWDLIKRSIMFDLVLLKFATHPDLRKKLLATDEAELIEGNTWGDVWWGVCNGNGRNELGKILMEVRGLLRER